jgi:hypothetical protein
MDIRRIWEVKMKAGILFRPGSVWIGAHWSPGNKRLCVNVIPFVTFWFTLKGGKTPDHKPPRKRVYRYLPRASSDSASWWVRTDVAERSPTMVRASKAGIIHH